MVGLMVPEFGWKTILSEAKRLRGVARQLVDDNWDKILYLGLELFTRHELNYREIEETLTRFHAETKRRKELLPNV
jgi:hypothetical protein